MANYSSKNWTDDVLLDLIRLEDDRAAFSELYRRYWEELIDAAFQRVKSKEAAEDAVQSVFVTFFIRRKEVAPKSSLAAYLHTALKFQIFKSYRSQQLHYSYLDEVIGTNSIQAESPDKIMEAKELRRKVYEIAGKLPEKCREVFLMSRFEQLSHQDIAEKLGISVSTVKKHINKALGVMRNEFKDHQFDLLILGMLMVYYSK